MLSVHLVIVLNHLHFQGLFREGKTLEKVLDVVVKEVLMMIAG